MGMAAALHRRGGRARELESRSRRGPFRRPERRPVFNSTFRADRALVLAAGLLGWLHDARLLIGFRQVAALWARELCLCVMAVGARQGGQRQ